MWSWITCAAASPRSSAARRSAPSIPAVTPGRKHPIAVDDHPFVHRDRTEEWQQVKRRPNAWSPDAPSASPAAPHSSAPVQTEKTLCAPAAWPPDPAEHFGILHERFLPESTGHVQNIQWWGRPPWRPSGANRNPFKSRTGSAVLP